MTSSQQIFVTFAHQNKPHVKNNISFQKWFNTEGCRDRKKTGGKQGGLTDEMKETIPEVKTWWEASASNKITTLHHNYLLLALELKYWKADSYE